MRPSGTGSTGGVAEPVPTIATTIPADNAAPHTTMQVTFMDCSLLTPDCPVAAYHTPWGLRSADMNGPTTPTTPTTPPTTA
ncbi:MAG: hypothetical protein HBSAPP03_03850 [Phycisphaerae bacterium]|nr:MAG: hypothetical protein HBSAPP03_03850 [Phycisphaerae bacterium]